MKSKITYFLLFFSILSLFLSCGPQRKNFVAKTYHNTTSYFNWYYNGERSWREGVAQIDQSFRVPPEGFIPILFYGGDGDAKPPSGNFDTAIEKAEMVLFRHDQEKNKWLDNCRHLIGRSWFYKQDYFLASQNFEYVLKTYPESKIIPSVYLWLAKTYYFSHRETRANDLMDEHFRKLKFNKKQKGELSMLKATMYMDNENYSAATKVLEKNLGFIRGRANRARVHYLMGQLYREQGKFAKAYEHFRKVTRINTDYEIIFNAKIQSIRLLLEEQEGVDESAKIQKMIRRMLRDEKNIDFKDQLYFELAMLELKKYRYGDAIDYLKESVAFNKDNTRQKAISYFTIGKVFFYNLQEFSMAATYFDSASTVVSQDDPEFDEISRIGKTLKEYVALRHTIYYQDSMVYLAGLDQGQLDQVVNNIIRGERQKKLDEERKKMEQQNKLNDPNFQDKFGNKNKVVSSFYFDNKSAVDQGKRAFQTIWGDRKNEDNWRRKNKQTVFTDEEEEEITGVQDSLLQEEFGDKYKYYKDVPKDDGELASAHLAIREAMLSLGTLFDKKLELQDSAIVLYSELIRRYPDTEEALKARFALYNIYKDIDPYAADDLKDYICGNFPESIYCKLINNQVTPEDLYSQEIEFQSAYNALYTTFSEKNYTTTIDFSKFILQKYPDVEEMPTVLYLRGLSYGETGNMDSLKVIFLRLIEGYPNAEVSPIARRTLELMGLLDVKKDDPKTGDKKEIEKNPEENDPRFKGFAKKPKKNEKIFVVMLLNKESIKSNELKILVAEFTKKYYKAEKLSTSIFFYKQKQHLAYISQFKTMEDGLGFIATAAAEEGLMGLFKKSDDKMFFITPNNFKEAYGKQRFEDYYEYYLKVILPSIKE